MHSNNTRDSHSEELELKLAVARNSISLLKDHLAKSRRDNHELHTAREENKLLAEVLNKAKWLLLVSIKGTPEQTNDAFGALNLACRAHWDWQTERISKHESSTNTSAGR